MGWKIVDDTLRSGVRPTARHVLMVLAHRANHDTGKCHPGLARLVRDTGLSRRAVQSAIIDLVKAGHISKFNVRGKGVNYFVHPRVGKRGNGAGDALVGGTPDTGGVHDQHLVGASPAPKPESTIIEPSLDQALILATDDILQLINWPRSEKCLLDVHIWLRRWLDEGFDLTADILSSVAVSVQQRPGRTNSMKRFDVPIRMTHASRVKGSAKAGHKEYKNGVGAIGYHVDKVVVGLSVE